jgi:hypothetical protein
MQEVLVKELLLSSPRTSFTTVEADGFLYLAGGFTNGNRVSSAIDVFDIASQTWNNTLTLPSPRAIVTPVHIPPHIYFIGGCSHLGSRNTFYNFDLPTQTFLEVTDAPSPQVQDPIQMSIHGSTLLVLGSNSAEFLNITDSSGGWTKNEELDLALQRVVGGIVFNHENFIFVIGGVNVSSRQLVSDAWIFDVDSSILNHYEGVITPINFSRNATKHFSYNIVNNVAAVWLSTNCFLVNLSTAKWLNFDIANVTNVVSVPGYTFVFTKLGFYTVDWTNTTTQPPFSESFGPIIHSVVFEDQAMYLVNNNTRVNYMVFTGGTWTTFSIAPAMSDMVVTLDWPPYGAVFASFDGFYLFDGTLSFVPQQRIQQIFNGGDEIHVICKQANSDKSIYSFGANLALLRSAVAAITPQAYFNGILFNFDNQRAFDVSAQILYNPYNDGFVKVLQWAGQGQYFFVLDQGNFTTETSDQVDIYNYKTDTWNTTSHPALLNSDGYLQGFNANGVLTILLGNLELTYNIVDDTWTTVNNTQTSHLSSQISPLVLDVNGTVYLLSATGVQLIIVENGGRSSSVIDETSSPVHFTYSTKFNQIFISTQTTTIFNWNLADQQRDIFLLPITDPEVILASSGNFLLVSGRNLPSLEYFDLSSKGWNKVPGLDNYIRPATMKTVTVNGTELILIAGGYDKEFSFYTDVVRLLDINSLASLPAPPSNEEPTTSVTEPAGGEDQDNTTLIVAIVVPVGAALIAGALLALFLLRKRQKKKKNKGNRMSMIGLDSSYGQWYIPFSDLTFGEQLGQGGSGQVFKGTWKNTSVALKLSMTQANKSVLGELSLMMALRPHPNVVQLLGFSVHPETDSIVLVLEYCNQGALDSTLFDSSHDITMTQKVEWLIGISKGLAHLHANNIVHRDVAARNVLLHQNDTKLTDFGMSREVAENQRGTTKSELGPIRWMAPESLKNKEYSVKSDVWSFGILAFEIIAQEEPHTKSDPIQVGRFIRDEGRTPELPVTCPEELASIIKNCWQLDPAKRPNFEEITPELEIILENLKAH